MECHVSSSNRWGPLSNMCRTTPAHASKGKEKGRVVVEGGERALPNACVCVVGWNREEGESTC